MLVTQDGNFDYGDLGHITRGILSDLIRNFGNSLHQRRKFDAEVRVSRSEKTPFAVRNSEDYTKL